MYYIEMFDHDTGFRSILSVKDRTEWKRPPIKHLEAAKAKFTNMFCRISGDSGTIWRIVLRHRRFGADPMLDYYGTFRGAKMHVRKLINAKSDWYEWSFSIYECP